MAVCLKHLLCWRRREVKSCSNTAQIFEEILICPAALPDSQIINSQIESEIFYNSLIVGVRIQKGLRISLMIFKKSRLFLRLSPEGLRDHLLFKT